MPGSSLCPSLSELESIRAGDEEAFGALHANWLPEFEQIASSFTRRPADFDDYVQVGLITFYKVCLRFPLARLANFERWVRRAIKRRMISLLRHERSKYRSAVALCPPDELDVREDATSEAIASLLQREETEALYVWINRLPTERRLIIDLLYWHKLNQAAIGRLLGYSRSRINQIKEELLEDARRFLSTLSN
jgi:RNA polymerase sigma factor (sigma-70 family)